MKQKIKHFLVLTMCICLLLSTCFISIPLTNPIIAYAEDSSETIILRGSLYSATNGSVIYKLTDNGVLYIENKGVTQESYKQDVINFDFNPNAIGTLAPYTDDIKSIVFTNETYVTGIELNNLSNLQTVDLKNVKPISFTDTKKVYSSIIYGIRCMNCPKLESIDVSNFDLKFIISLSLSGCTGLREVTIPKDTSYSSIQYNAHKDVGDIILGHYPYNGYGYGAYNYNINANTSETIPIKYGSSTVQCFFVKQPLITSLKYNNDSITYTVVKPVRKISKGIIWVMANLGKLSEDEFNAYGGADKLSYCPYGDGKPYVISEYDSNTEYYLKLSTYHLSSMTIEDNEELYINTAEIFNSVNRILDDDLKNYTMSKVYLCETRHSVSNTFPTVQIEVPKTESSLFMVSPEQAGPTATISIIYTKSSASSYSSELNTVTTKYSNYLNENTYKVLVNGTSYVPDAECTHTTTEVINKKDATTEDTGYTGDIICSKCKICISKGEEIPKLEVICSHVNTKIVNQVDATIDKVGYTGDTVCIDCNEIITKGKEIPKVVCKHETTKTINQIEATTENVGYTGDIICATCNKVITKGEEIPKLTSTNTPSTDKPDTTEQPSTDEPTTSEPNKPIIKPTVKLKNQKITTTKIKTYKVKNLKKKSVSFNLKAKASGKGKLTYKVVKSKNSKYITVSKIGKVTLKKGIKKGTYKIIITAANTTKYKKAIKTISIKVK